MSGLLIKAVNVLSLRNNINVLKYTTRFILCFICVWDDKCLHQLVLSYTCKDNVFPIFSSDPDYVFV